MSPRLPAPIRADNACHTTSARFARHSDGKVTLNFDTAFGAATYNDTSGAPGTPGNGYFSCSNSYCHSNGTSVSTGTVPANVSTAWGSGLLSCDACHGYPPSYANETPKTNSHGAHAADPCNRCHVTTTANRASISSRVTHVNKAYNVAPEAVSGVVHVDLCGFGRLLHERLLPRRGNGQVGKHADLPELPPGRR